jgi:hypothetical protein
MKVYISGSQQGQIKLFIKELTRRGHTITYDWTVNSTVENSHGNCLVSATNTFEGIKDADLVIVSCITNTENSRVVFTDMGIALGMCKPVFLLNENHTECLTWLPSNRVETLIHYHYSPQVTVFTNWEKLVAALTL